MTSGVGRPLTLLVLALLLGACGTEAEPDATVAARQGPIDLGALDAALYLSDLEDTLTARQRWQNRFRITSEGAFAADLAGALIFEGDSVELSATGSFGGDSVNLSLTALGARVTGGNGTDRFDVPSPPALREALVVGMMRMGLLHNLARLSAGAPPDRMEGGVREWVEVSNLTWSPAPDPTPGVVAGGIAFGITVSNQPAGDATLWVDSAGQPIARNQTVRFPGGEMRVREEYEIR